MALGEVSMWPLGGHHAERFAFPFVPVSRSPALLQAPSDSVPGAGGPVASVRRAAANGFKGSAPTRRPTQSPRRRARTTRPDRLSASRARGWSGGGESTAGRSARARLRTPSATSPAHVRSVSPRNPAGGRPGPEAQSAQAEEHPGSRDQGRPRAGLRQTTGRRLGPERRISRPRFGLLCGRSEGVSGRVQGCGLRFGQRRGFRWRRGCRWRRGFRRRGFGRPHLDGRAGLIGGDGIGVGDDDRGGGTGLMRPAAGRTERRVLGFPRRVGRHCGRTHPRPEDREAGTDHADLECVENTSSQHALEIPHSMPDSCVERPFARSVQVSSGVLRPETRLWCPLSDGRQPLRSGASLVNSGLQPLGPQAVPPFEMTFAKSGSYSDAGAAGETNRDRSTTWKVEMGTTTAHTDILAFAPVPAAVKKGAKVTFVNNSMAPTRRASSTRRRRS